MARNPNVLERLFIGAAWVALLAGLTLPSITPGTANITTLVLMGIGLGVLAFQPRTRLVIREPAVWMTLLAGAILLVALVPTASSPMHLVSILILAPLWLVAPHGALLDQLRSWLRPRIIAVFALAGSGGGAAVAATDVLIFGQERGGWLVNNPIHLADLTLMLGFIALVGLTDKHRFNLFFVLGPLFALVAIWFSGSRGPLVAFAPMLVLGGGALALLLLPPRRAVLLLGAGCLLLAAVGFALLGSGAAGRLGEIVDISTLLSGRTADASTNERLHMLQSAVEAFWSSPVYGHGFLDYAAVAQSYVPPGMGYGPWGHLHNDPADFAVIGGTLGLLSYALLLLAPLVSGLGNRGRWRPATIYLGITLPVGYFAMGLTNAMFGVLAQTTLYAVVLSLIATLTLVGKDPSA
jgi:O-antigen ligase